MKKTVTSLLLSAVLLLAFLVPAFAAKAAATKLEDGSYAVDYEVKSKTGIQKPVLPVSLEVKDGKAYAKIIWNDPEVDKLYLGEEVLLPAGTVKIKHKNGKLPCFLVPIAKFGKPQTFVLHTRGNNLETDEYTLTVAAYDKDFDADFQAEVVAMDNEGAQPIRFYKWNTGGSYLVWGPFVLLAVSALATLLTLKKFDDSRK